MMKNKSPFPFSIFKKHKHVERTSDASPYAIPLVFVSDRSWWSFTKKVLKSFGCLFQLRSNKTKHHGPAFDRIVFPSIKAPALSSVDFSLRDLMSIQPMKEDPTKREISNFVYGIRIPRDLFILTKQNTYDGLSLSRG